ncbi:hypothetical protein AUEXF2481DRAFT_27524 [Aureobasidium subglaciale EXF-2481]|uniref:Uncharacterized protein n=1 Tax=Aureobasidium subglaciale (strain EXF-2481) TaxID=1043005 RepID=A0A074YHS1_AURSE|nr:uncharacterized protein AUEXF2481DRAFT_27524 [Aureobasidium subglaciale EXF-2481]KAI5205884.1 hypothetical protein E4T38_03979 [Aureobasidium subglaciale]KAI5224844.1 hypothetical protein E4T40_03754 [Aureobasidium subglaciale]KAI5227950.1 hypothetical protein E4T41_03974 [Aureobasidium subglaciale]KAI5263544.1 hypothetical protein E4T46_03595 [Aureobasidium subglaciale]KEQ97260.1 hypothetical protein AUEXF2481DRAFT_27524 [Aureobasidium subglaciale EXF-2481]
MTHTLLGIRLRIAAELNGPRANHIALWPTHATTTGAPRRKSSLVHPESDIRRIDLKAQTTEDGFTEGDLKAPDRSVPIRDVSENEEIASAALDTRPYSPDLDIKDWSSKLFRPPDSYWKKWVPLLGENNLGGSDTVLKSVNRYWRGKFETRYIRRKHGPSHAERDFYCCSNRYPITPLLGTRIVYAFGHTKEEAFENVGPAIVSELYKAGALDKLYENVIVSRKIIDIYEQAARYGLYPRFSAVARAKSVHRFRITMEVPEWNVRAMAIGRTYIEALEAVIESYDDQVNERGVKRPLTPEATKDRLQGLNVVTSSRTLQFLLQKLHLSSIRTEVANQPLLEGRYVCKIWAKGELISAGVPMGQVSVAKKISRLTGAVRLLQRFGFDAVEGLEEGLEADNAEDITQKSIDRGEHEMLTTDEQAMADLFDSFDSLLDDTAVGETNHSKDEELR